MSAQVPVQAQPRLAHAHASAADVLAGFAIAASQPRDLDGMLAQAAAAVREILDADRVTILFTAAGESLVPAVAIARQDDATLWQRFRGMPPIRFDDWPATLDLLRSGKPIVIADAGTSTLIPLEWRRAFRLTLLLVAPLVIADQVLGVLAVEDSRVRRGFSDEQVRTLQGLAALAALCIRQARDRSEAAGQASLGAALAAASTADAVCETAVDAYCADGEVVGCQLVGWSAEEPAAVTTLAGRGAPQPGPAGAPGDELARLVREVLSTEPVQPWLGPAPEPHPSGARSVLLEPLRGSEGPVGCALVWLASEPDGTTGPERLHAIANHVGPSLARARTTQRLGRAERLSRELRRIAREYVGLDDVRPLLDALAPVVRAATGMDLLDLHLTAATPAKRLHVNPPRGALASVMRRWRNHPDEAEPQTVDGRLALPARLADGTWVALVLRRPADAATPGPVSNPEFVDDLTGVVANLLSLAVLRLRALDGRADLERARAQLDAVAEAYQPALSAIDRAGALLQAARAHPAEPAQIDRARLLLAEAHQLVASTPTSGAADAQAPLARALSRLVEHAATECGIEVDLRTSGTPVTLSAAVESALLQVARRTLSEAGAAQSSTALVHLHYATDGAELAIHCNRPFGCPTVLPRESSHAFRRSLDVALAGHGTIATFAQRSGGLQVKAHVGCTRQP